ncbi:hypothetical protein MTR67_046050 [Solanum verrucosum]|uniref:Uncharacterized protein n=1 Tax=Solanum verrucosum TaxID=315347 RepID=A0AAF0UV70_SOLVR|nr:hypothetical protein MTR67_046050 [Solanum verrucosum]
MYLYIWHIKACLDSKTIKRVIYTYSDGALCFNEESPDIVDENWWSDTNFIKKLKPSGVFYCISKTLTENEALNFAQKNNLDLVCVNHAWVFGPFVTPQCPILVLRHMTKAFKFPRLSSKKLLDDGFKYKYDLGDMYDGAIASCK